jgi:DNA polymerase I
LYDILRTDEILEILIMPKPLILIDGSSYLFRAFHALPPLINTKGQATGAIYGVVNMLKRIIKDYSPTHMVVVFDAPGKTFREELYPEYKAHRPPTPKDLSSQFAPLIQLIKAMGLPLLCVDGVEADDVIGSIAHFATQQEIPVVISTSDKDLAQLVNQHVTLIDTMSQTTLDIAGVKNKFGIAPEQMIDYLALVGDTSDNVPGVSKCGAKTAVKWLTQYQTLDNLLANADAISGKIGESLRASFDIVKLSKQLVTIKTNLDLNITLESMLRQPIDPSQLQILVEELEFKSWLNELRKNSSTQNPSATNANLPQIITNQTALEQFLQQCNHAKRLSIYTAINHADIMCAELVGIALALDLQHAVYIPFTHNDTAIQLDRTKVLQALQPYLENNLLPKLGHNLKNDYTILKHYGITLRGLTFDLMLESYVLNSTNKHDLDNLALTILNHNNITYSSIVGSGSKQLSLDQIPIHPAATYALEKAKIILQIHDQIYPDMPEAIKQVLTNIEMPLVSVLAEIENHGVLIDSEVLHKHGERLKQVIHNLEQEAYALADMTFNLNSPKQLQEVLYQILKLPVIAKTPTGQPSTAEAVLEELALSYRLPLVIVEYRRLTKLVSTYIDALPKRVNSRTQRVHTSYNQAVTATGRLSSSEPNLQNIPIRSEEGRLIRHAFIAPPDHVLISADYSQIELRIMAHLSQDPQLLHAFIHDLDIHAATASEIFSVPLQDVTDEQRRRAKAVNFGLIYGMSAFGLAKQLNVERADAQYYLDRYFQRYPGVLEYMEKTRQYAHQHGYVETIFGRRLYLPEINTNNNIRRKAAERMAINAPMQGTAADLIKQSMLAIANWQQNSNTNTRMIMQVHDELVFEVRHDEIQTSSDMIKQLMENTVKLSIPLKISLGCGNNWEEAHG